MAPPTRAEALVPVDVPVIGPQHGVAPRTMLVTRSHHDARLAHLQRNATRQHGVGGLRSVAQSHPRPPPWETEPVIYHPDGKVYPRDWSVNLRNAYRSRSRIAGALRRSFLHLRRYKDNGIVDLVCLCVGLIEGGPEQHDMCVLAPGRWTNGIDRSKARYAWGRP
jgi:hypothetical protein